MNMAITKTEMKTKRVVVEIPKNAKTRDLKLLVKRFFSFDVKRIYGKDKNFPTVRIRWRASA
jgi:hypothetical protein